MKRFLALTFGLFLLYQVHGQEEWTYTGFYPWYWLPSEEAWIYAPNQPQYVWSDEASGWVANPLSALTFDIGEVTSKSPFEIELQIEGGQPMLLTLNLSGSSNGLLQLGDVSRSISYRYSADPVSGNLLLFGKLGVDAAGSFSLQLKFDSLEAGHFTLIGDMEFSSCAICELTGVFNVLE